MRHTFIALLMCAILGGCFSFNKVTPEKCASVTGLRALVDRGNPVSMLFVHGMGIHPRGYSDKLQTGFSDRLGLDLDNKPSEYEIKRGKVTVAYLRVRVARNSVAQPKLRFVELTWSTLTTTIKHQLLEINQKSHEESSDIEADRLLVNSIAKKFVNTRFSDAVLYSGALKKELNSIVAEAICTLSLVTIWKDGECSNVETPQAGAHDIVLVTQSLGSAMVFDTLANLGQAASTTVADKTPYSAAALDTIANTRFVYMLANQLPLIDLSNIQGPISENWLNHYPCKGAPSPSKQELDGDAGPEPGIGGFLRLQATSHKDSDNKLEITALTDPNDVLSYWLTTNFKKSCETTSVLINNVKVRNAQINWFFVYASVIKAHTGFEGNRKVIDFLVDGT